MNQPFDFRAQLRPRLRNVDDVIADIRARLNGRARHYRLGRRHWPLVDDLADLWAAIRANPASHAVACFGGVAVGLALTLGPAFVWSLFL